MGQSAERVLAVLDADIERTETQIAVAAGISLGETQRGLDELALCGAVADRFSDGLRVWRIADGVIAEGVAE